MKRSGSADLALMGGVIPSWLFDRMTKLSLPIVEAIVMEYGQQGFLSRLSDPFWFQSFGAVIGMDWNSSGVTTAVMSALKKSLNPHSKELGLYVCGGKGKDSMQTPHELMVVGDKTGLDGNYLAHCSKLSAKVDYGILTATIAKGTFGVTPSEHKKIKGLASQELRDHMTPMELILTALSEEVTRTITIENDAQGFNENHDAAVKGGLVGAKARRNVEEATGKKVVSSDNFLGLKDGEKSKELPPPD